jgi:hypothetical protein
MARGECYILSTYIPLNTMRQDLFVLKKNDQYNFSTVSFNYIFQNVLCIHTVSIRVTRLGEFFVH